ncbi:hypothetical protein ACH5RR_016927 [Cinchona calisaya]|uniref:CDC20/Fizzy WD40 domain-containing protein n=1 Tax=Cinchona calisaya TaxID=153742 RepID=A0ABD2ZYK6_9GENT
MGENPIWKLQSDWYSPTRLHSSPVDYDFPGDRFIPNRSLMDLDQAHSLLTSSDTEFRKPKFHENYRKKLNENLKLDIEGRPFRMLVFRGSPKSSRRSSRHIDEMRRSDEEIIAGDSKQQRIFPKKESYILDAPNLKDDFYMNVMDWGRSNMLAVALGSALYTWNACNRATHKLLDVESESDYPTSLAWSGDAKMIAVGHMCSDIQIWDAEASKLVRSLRGHQNKVGSIAWNGHILTSGSEDKAIVNHDVRAKNSVTCYMKVHTRGVCSLKWSTTGNILASGGDDNLVYIWHASRMSSLHYMYRLKAHGAAVKALAWCPYNSDVLASGGGLDDGCLKIWNVQKGVCINSIDTQAQVSGLQWNRHHKEILSGHGYSRKNTDCQNQLCLWKYPSMSKIGGSRNHESRVLHLSQSPDGSTVASAGADQTIRIWEVFGPPQADEPTSSGLDSLLAFKAFPIR